MYSLKIKMWKYFPTKLQPHRFYKLAIKLKILAPLVKSLEICDYLLLCSCNASKKYVAATANFM